MVKRYAHFAPEHLRAAPANLLRFRYGRQRHHCRKRRNMLIIWLPDQARTWDLRIDSPSRHCSESRASQSSYGTRRAALWVIATLLLLDRSGRRLTPIPHPMATRICRGYDLRIQPLTAPLRSIAKQGRHRRALVASPDSCAASRSRRHCLFQINAPKPVLGLNNITMRCIGS